MKLGLSIGAPIDRRGVVVCWKTIKSTKEPRKNLL